MTRSPSPPRSLFPARQTVEKQSEQIVRNWSRRKILWRSQVQKQKTKKKKAKKIEIKYEIKSNQIKVYVANIGEP